ncbi:PAS domain S-box protein [Methanosarcina sp. DH2]|uniref:MEDS domain-containing protein n=1 Tax=Methanosarcina sp. DH2 TaxID=2605639 RepID=UPI001E333DCE|nr:MEDS domain-containing protein [Methanosarcina sp. DH2]MCC4770748.1 PAS domain S-box protein [Methanosarcina sp. DH2]
MNGKLRKSGIDIIVDLPWGTHFCLFFRTKEDLLDILVPYFKAGLENNEFCIWITSLPSEVENAKEALKKVVSDFDVYLEKGQIEFIPYIDWYLKNGIFDSEKIINTWIKKLNNALASGYDGLRIAENTSWLDKEDWNNFVDYEKKVDSLTGKYRMIAQCPYCLDAYSAAETVDVIVNHQFTLTRREGKWEQVESSRRRQAEETLHESEVEYHRLLESMREAFFVADIITNEAGEPVDYLIVEANQALESQTGVPLEQFIGNTALRMYPGLDKFWIKTYGRVALTGKPEQFDYYADVQKRHYEVSAYQIRPGRFAAIFLDITDRKRAEEALIRNENEFRTLAENSPDIISRFDRQKRHIYANPAAVEPYGRSPEEIIGKTNSDLGMDPQQVKFWEEHYENVFATEKPETMEFHYKSPERKEYYFNTRIVPEFVDGEVTSVLAISRDITDIKEAEAKSKETLDNLEKLVEERTAELKTAYKLLKENEKGLAEAQKMAHMGNWEWDIAADKAYWSEEMYRIFGRDPKKGAPPYNEYLSYIHPDDRDYFDNATKKAVNGRPYSIEYRIALANGEERIVHMQAEVIFGEKNIPIRVKGIVQDITERKKAEKALINLEIARKKEIHHRIKNNLQVISSLLDLQAENFSNRKCVKDSDVLNAFRESQDRVMSIALIHEELHEGGGDNALYFSPYLEKLVENLFQTYSLGNADVSLSMDLEDDVFFDMDTAVPLGIIVNELVSNSLKHAFPGRDKGKIQIKLFKEAKAGSESNNNKEKLTGKGTGYTLIVSDDGTGIPDKIDLKNSDTLGLQLVNILVDQLDGEIELKRNKGTEFVININI